MNYRHAIAASGHIIQSPFMALLSDRQKFGRLWSRSAYTFALKVNTKNANTYIAALFLTYSEIPHGASAAISAGFMCPLNLSRSSVGSAVSRAVYCRGPVLCRDTRQRLKRGSCRPRKMNGLARICKYLRMREEFLLDKKAQDPDPRTALALFSL